jgi:hypothetical protein
MAKALDGQMALFGGLCEACGEVPAYVQYQRGRYHCLCCARCDKPVQDLACGCSDVWKEAPGRDTRG